MIQAHLAEEQGIAVLPSWSLELSVPLSVEEGEFILGAFTPDRVEEEEGEFEELPMSGGEGEEVLDVPTDWNPEIPIAW